MPALATRCDEESGDSDLDAKGVFVVPAEFVGVDGRCDDHSSGVDVADGGVT